MSSGAGNGNGGGDGGGALRNTTAVVVAIAALIVLVIAIAVLWDKADDPNNETAWARWTFLLAGIEAIAFAGAGFLFGREVNRAAAETAQSATETANEQTTHAAATEASGRNLRDLVLIKAARAGGGTPPRSDLLGEADLQQTPADWREVADFAQRLFPN